MTQKVDVVLKFNSRTAGGGQVMRKRYPYDESMPLYEYVDSLIHEATRAPEHGQSIAVTGFSVELV